MDCKHDWRSEDIGCWVCRKCGATKRRGSNGIIRCYDAEGKHIPTDGNVSMKTIRQIEQELKKR